MIVPPHFTRGPSLGARAPALVTRFTTDAPADASPPQVSRGR